jgi:hypothetical protein
MKIIGGVLLVVAALLPGAPVLRAESAKVLVPHAFAAAFIIVFEQEELP